MNDTVQPDPDFEPSDKVKALVHFEEALTDALIAGLTFEELSIKFIEAMSIHYGYDQEDTQ